MHAQTMMLQWKNTREKVKWKQKRECSFAEEKYSLQHRVDLIMKYQFNYLIILLQFTLRKNILKVCSEEVFTATMPQLTLSQEIESALLQERLNIEYFIHSKIINEFYEKRKNWVTSNVGTLIFKDPNGEVFHRLRARKQKSFVIYIYNEWSVLYTGSDLANASLARMMDNCSVKNCIFTRDKKYIHSADAILVNMHKGQYPRFAKTNPKQKWVLFSIESPLNTFGGYKFRRKISPQNFSGLFNWIMTYRSDSDVPVPFGRVLPLQTPIKINLSNTETALSELVPFWYLKQYKILAVTMVSNCVFKKRLQFVRKLMKVMLVDAYGNCAVDKQLRKSCPGHIHRDCSVLEHYIFYLVLENSNCRQYLTEKIFHNAYSKGAIPIVWGAPLVDCQKLLPPNSFLHVDHYTSYEHLAWHIKHISQNKQEILKYHEWRKHFTVANEHGFFGTQSKHFCRLCEGLNYNDHPTRTYYYDELRLFFDGNLICS